MRMLQLRIEIVAGAKNLAAVFQMVQYQASGKGARLT
jgi:hypothetical protein